ncbi:MAG: hypothetical protein ACK5JD_05070 [Mangrovibacterium sp.]
MTIKTFFTAALLFVAALMANAQELVYLLHPLVGDTINLEEKQTYLLFESVPDSLFGLAVIYETPENYLLKVSKDANEARLTLSPEEIETYQTNISKLSVYYQRQQTQTADTLVNLMEQSDTITAPRLMDEYISPEQLVRIKREARRFLELSQSAEEYGLQGTDKQRYIEKNGNWTIWYIEHWNPSKQRRPKF